MGCFGHDDFPVLAGLESAVLERTPVKNGFCHNRLSMRAMVAGPASGATVYPKTTRPLPVAAPHVPSNRVIEPFPSTRRSRWEVDLHNKICILFLDQYPASGNDLIITSMHINALSHHFAEVLKRLAAVVGVFQLHAKVLEALFSK